MDCCLLKSGHTVAGALNQRAFCTDLLSYEQTEWKVNLTKDILYLQVLIIYGKYCFVQEPLEGLERLTMPV